MDKIGALTHGNGANSRAAGKTTIKAKDENLVIQGIRRIETTRI